LISGEIGITIYINKMKAERLKKAAPWFIGGLTTAFIFANIAGSAYFNHTFLRPRRKKNLSSDLTGYVPEAAYTTEEFQFRSDDGLLISALHLEPSKTNGHAILICHGLAHDKLSGIRYVQYLLKEGYRLILMDFRNHGQSEGTITTYGHFEKQDLLGAIRYLRKNNFHGKIGILGASMGASIALITAAETEEISGMVLDSPFGSLQKMCSAWAVKTTHFPEIFLKLPMNLAYCWLYFMHRFWVPELEPALAARKLKCPVFLIHGGKDQRIPPEHSRSIFENLSSEKELWIVEDVDHLGVYLNHPEEYQQRVLKFFHKSLQVS
jgi:dipeptidyl aminopeptidase/acylaminoacyl peptidase